MTRQAPSADPLKQSSKEVPVGRLYSGMHSSERTTERYGRLVEAGIEIFGTAGYSTARIKTICQRAGLSERYFYESFDSREQLLTAIYDNLSSTLMREVVLALEVPGMALKDAVRAGLAVVVNFMLGDPRHARIILVEIVGVSSELESKRHHSLTEFAKTTMRQLLLLGGIDPAEAQRPLTACAEDGLLAEVLDFARLTAISIVGGVNNMLCDALLSETTANTERITEVAYQLTYNASTGVRTLAAQGEPAGLV